MEMAFWRVTWKGDEILKDVEQHIFDLKLRLVFEGYFSDVFTDVFAVLAIPIFHWHVPSSKCSQVSWGLARWFEDETKDEDEEEVEVLGDAGRCWELVQLDMKRESRLQQE